LGEAGVSFAAVQGKKRHFGAQQRIS